MKRSMPERKLTIVFSLSVFYFVLFSEPKIGQENLNGSYRIVNALLKIMRTVHLLINLRN